MCSDIFTALFLV